MPTPSFQPKPGRALVAMVLVVELVVAVAALAARPGNLASSSNSVHASASGTAPGPHAVLPTLPPTTAPPPPPTVSTVAPGAQLPADQTEVSGTITHAQATNATMGILALPITIRASERGFGNSATISGAEVDGQPASIEWDAGTPFPLSGSGGLALVGVLVHVDGPKVTVQVGGGTYHLTPGVYHLASPAAVSTNGLAAPVTSVSFTATTATTITFTGSETFPTHLPIHLVGPGKVILDGAFTVRTSQGSRPATHVELATGPYDLRFTAGSGGTKVDAILQGAVTIS